MRMRHVLLSPLFIGEPPLTNFVLKIIDLFKGFFRLMGVDYGKFRILLWAKLTVDNRQEKSIAQRQSKKEMSNSMVWVVVIYAFMGIFTGILLMVMQSIFISHHHGHDSRGSDFRFYLGFTGYHG